MVLMRTPGHSLRGALPAFLLVLTVAFSARAQLPPSRPSGVPLGAAAATSTGAPVATPSRSADELFRRAGQAYDAADFNLAHALYSDAFEKKKTHDIAAMLAQTEMKLGKLCEAAAHLDFAVQSFPPSLTDERRARIERAHAEVKKQVAALRVEVTPKDADVQVDFKTIAAKDLPGPFCVPAGDRVLYISHDGFAVERRTVTLEGSTAETVTIEMRRVASSPLLDPAPPPPRGETSPRPQLGDPLRPAGFALLGTGIAAGVAGAVFLSFARVKQSEADHVLGGIKAGSGTCPRPTGSPGLSDYGPQCTQLGRLRADAATFDNAALSSAIGGAVLGVVGSLLLLRPKAASAPPVTLQVTSSGAHLALSGAF
jgi:hypothetical protein